MLAAMVAGTTNSMSTPAASMLDETPTTIENHFSVVGDSFYVMDIPKFPMHHDGKKGYFVDLRQASFQWDVTKLAEVKATLCNESGVEGW